MLLSVNSRKISLQESLVEYNRMKLGSKELEGDGCEYQFGSQRRQPISSYRDFKLKIDVKLDPIPRASLINDLSLPCALL
jgi:hypothetical protein